jgi:hypothetical protein
MTAALLALAACTGEPRDRRPPPPVDTDTDTDTDSDTDSHRHRHGHRHRHRFGHRHRAAPLRRRSRCTCRSSRRARCRTRSLRRVCTRGLRWWGTRRGSLVLSVPSETAGVAVTCHHQWYAPETLVLVDGVGGPDVRDGHGAGGAAGDPARDVRAGSAGPCSGRGDGAGGGPDRCGGDGWRGVRLDVEATGSLVHDPSVLHLEYGLGTSLPTGGTHVLFLGVPAGSVGVHVTVPTGSCTTWPGSRLVDRVPVGGGRPHHDPDGVRALTPSRSRTRRSPPTAR